MERSNPDCLPHSNTPLYLPAYLRQYSKEVTDFRLVNWESSLPSYQLQFLDPDSGIESDVEQVFFSFGKKNCWLWEDEYCLLEDILDRVEQMTIRYSHRVRVGPDQPIYGEEVVEDIEHDLISGYFKVYAVVK